MQAPARAREKERRDSRILSIFPLQHTEERPGDKGKKERGVERKNSKTICLFGRCALRMKVCNIFECIASLTWLLSAIYKAKDQETRMHTHRGEVKMTMSRHEVTH